MSRIHERLAVLASAALSLTLLAAAPAHARPPTISCIGGISTGTACICNQPSEKIQTGPNTYRCVMGDLTTVSPVGPFGLRAQAQPGIVVGSGRFGGGFGRPMHQFGHPSSLPQGRPMMVR